MVEENRPRALLDLSAPSVSLSEAHRSVPIPVNLTRFKRFLAFAGPAYLVSVGYMDPGNWATDLLGGSKFGYALLWVVLASNLMAILLQTLCARLGLVTGHDLAQCCRAYYKKPATIALWFLCEIAIIACDLAEVIGSAVALQLLFHIPLLVGVLITGFDVLVLLLLSRFGFRKVEALIITLVATVAGCFLLEIFLARPDWPQSLHGMVTPTLPSKEALVVSLGILGATVMPHNLYLHSSLVQTRAHDRSESGVKQAIRYNTLDTALALGAAFFVNAAILILAAAAFHGQGKIIDDFRDAPALLHNVLGPASAIAFAVALLAAGQSSTITGTLAGQIVMEGFLNLRMAPWLRRLVTRSLAIIPAVLLISARGESGTVELVVLSQVVLSLQLSFAVFPLVMLTSDAKRMGKFVNPLWLKVLSWAVALIIAVLNLYLLYQTAQDMQAASKFPAVTALGGLIVLTALFALWVRYGYKDKAAPPPVTA